jgi:glycosyltransferase involved in cell wall biosynthesis
MIIGIDGSRAFFPQRTGIEEYSYQVIKHLVDKLKDHEVVLFVRKSQQINFSLPENWTVKIIKWPRFWTQIGLSLEMLLHPVDVLFVPAHTVPFIHPARNASLFMLALSIQSILKTLGISTYYNKHSDAGGPKKTIVTVHGLEYEIMPQAYSGWERFYMRLSIKNSCRWAQTIIAVSENTKKDLMRLYQVPESKIEIVYEGYEDNFEIKKFKIESKFKIQNSKFLLFIGRLEERKNILGIIKAFEILKEKYSIPHKLVLAGRSGYGFSKIEVAISSSKYNIDIVQLGFVPDEDKFQLIAQADVFMFPTLYEGFGIPVLEAQSVGVPVVTSNVSSLPEVAGDSAILVDPNDSVSMAEQTYALISNKSLRDAIIKKGYENVEKFSCEKCAQEISEVLIMR